MSHNIVKILKPYALFLAGVLVTLSVFRLCLLLWQLDRVQDSGGAGFILIQGVRFDLILAAIVLLLPLVISPLVAMFNRPQRWWNMLMKSYLSLAFMIIVFLELSTPSFINQYDLRPNYIFIEYLKYPREVFSTLWTAYKLQLIVSIAITAFAGHRMYRLLSILLRSDTRLSPPVAILISPVLLLLCVLMIRSTLGHRPANPSIVAFSPDPLVNTLSYSSIYSVLYAIYDQRHQDSGGFTYGVITDEMAMELVKQNMLNGKGVFVSDAIPTLHKQQAYIQRKRPLNLVIILEESLGAEFVGKLGGLPLTPNIDSLSEQGIWFDHMYATGTRSVRGIEAIVSGFPPTTSSSVVKLNKSQRNFFTIAQLLSDYKYDTSFIYGGESHFDNMRGFFANNGFKHIHDINDYDNPVFTGSWGVSDEDLFNKAHSIFSNYPENQPFFSLVFTTTNHSPFEFPDGRIKLYDTDKNTVNNAVKYTDYALGEFIKKARASSYWNNTLFLVVADHNSRVYGSELVPIKRFHIPALLLGADIQPQHYAPVASQIDLLPTLLSFMGINSTLPAIGDDLAENILNGIKRHGHAMMQFGDSQAYMESDKVVILQKNKPPGHYIYKNDLLAPVDRTDSKFEQRALAYARWPMLVYDEELYKLHNSHNAPTLPASAREKPGADPG